MTTAVEHRFGPYGGQYVPETLMPALAELEAAWLAARDDAATAPSSRGLLRDYVGRPTPLYHAERLSEAAGRPVWLKREDLNHTGAHKINNALGQGLLAKRMGKTRIIAETGAGQHGVATATACALLGPRVHRLHGLRGHPPPDAQRPAHGAAGRDRSAGVDAGARTLKEAVSAAIRDWVTNVGDTHYVIGSCVGPAPFPAIVRDLQRVIGDEARAQMLERAGRLPAARRRLRRRRLERDRHLRPVRRRRRRRAGRRRGGGRRARHAAPRRAADRRRPRRRPARLLLGDHAGRGRPDPRGALDLRRASTTPASGPEHAWLRDSGRARYEAVTDAEALAAFRARRARGDHPGARVLARARLGARQPAPAATTPLDLVCLSGRGDKDLAEVLERLGMSVDGRPRHDRRRLRARGQARRADAVPDGRLPGRSTPRARSATPTPRTAPTCSRSASRTPTRWPTARSSTPRAPRRSRRAPPLHAVLDVGRALAESVPVVLMCYANLVSPAGPSASPTSSPSAASAG